MIDPNPTEYWRGVEAALARAQRKTSVVNLRRETFCKPGPCHGDILAKWVDAQFVPEPERQGSLFDARREA